MIGIIILMVISIPKEWQMVDLAKAEKLLRAEKHTLKVCRESYVKSDVQEKECAYNKYAIEGIKQYIKDRKDMVAVGDVEDYIYKAVIKHENNH